MRGKLACCKYSQTTKKGKHRKTKQHSSGNTLIHVVVKQQKKNPTAAFREALRVIGKKHSTSSTSAHIAGDKLSIMELFTSFRSTGDIFSFFLLGRRDTQKRKIDEPPGPVIAQF